MKDKNNIEIEIGNLIVCKGDEYVVNGFDCGCVEIIKLGDGDVVKCDELEVIGDLGM